jgi:hypothetical protein
VVEEPDYESWRQVPGQIVKTNSMRAAAGSAGKVG